MIPTQDRAFFAFAFASVTALILLWTHIYLTQFSSSLTNPDANEHQQQHNNNNTLQDNDTRIDITSLGVNRDFVYMFIMDRTDIGFYRTQKIYEDVILIAEHPAQCHGLERCLALHEEFEYLTLHDKVFKTLILLTKTFKNWNSISKLDDDALVDIRSLRKVHQITGQTYMGHIYTNTYAKGFDITYATGHYYTLGKNLVECVLNHRDDFFGLGTGAEDATIGWVIAEFCEHDLVDVKHFPYIWHKNLDNHKNKRCELAAPVSSK